MKHHHHKGAGKAAKSAACSTDTAAAKAGKNAARRAAVKRAYVSTNMNDSGTSETDDHLPLLSQGTRAARAARLAA